MPTSSIEPMRLNELDGWIIRHGEQEVRVLAQGAQVISYRVGDAPPIIWLSEEAAYAAGQSVRGGVPVCWPWFGDLTRNNQAVQNHFQAQVAPAHGLVRGVPWTLQALEYDEHAAYLRLGLDTRQQPLVDWPHACSLSLEVRVAEQLTLTLTSQNHNPYPLHLSQALHTYLAVGDIHCAQVQGLDGCQYLDALDNWQTRTQVGPILFHSETDRVYQDVPSHLSVIDPTWNRRIHLRTDGSSSAVVWNPWIEKSLRLSQFAPDAWQRMLCVESANIVQDTIELSEGQRHTLSVHISSQPLTD